MHAHDLGFLHKSIRSKSTGRLKMASASPYRQLNSLSIIQKHGSYVREVGNAAEVGTISLSASDIEMNVHTVRADSKTSLALRVNGGISFFTGDSLLRPDTRFTVALSTGAAALGPKRLPVLLLSCSYATIPRSRCSVATSASIPIYKKV